MRRHAHGSRGALLAAVLAIQSVACLSRVNQDVLYGTPRPTASASAASTIEKRAGSGEGDAECRRVVTTAPMEREETVHRTFVAPEAQTSNLAWFTILGGAVAFQFYATDQANCPDNGGGCGGLLATQIATAAAAAIPLGFLIYNAVKVQDTRRVVADRQERVEGPWGPCADSLSPSP